MQKNFKSILIFIFFFLNAIFCEFEDLMKNRLYPSPLEPQSALDAATQAAANSAVQRQSDIIAAKVAANSAAQREASIAAAKAAALSV